MECVVRRSNHSDNSSEHATTSDMGCLTECLSLPSDKRRLLESMLLSFRTKYTAAIDQYVFDVPSAEHVCCISLSLRWGNFDSWFCFSVQVCWIRLQLKRPMFVLAYGDISSFSSIASEKKCLVIIVRCCLGLFEISHLKFTVWCSPERAIYLQL